MVRLEIRLVDGVFTIARKIHLQIEVIKKGLEISSGSDTGYRTSEHLQSTCDVLRKFESIHRFRGRFRYVQD